MKRQARWMKRTIMVSIAMAFSWTAVTQAALNFGGTIVWIEVWRTGNVAFRLSDPASTTTCNGQFILNASDPGIKNQYAALLAAKKTSSTVSVYSYSPCGPADGYGSNYIVVDYLYVTQD